MKAFPPYQIGVGSQEERFKETTDLALHGNSEPLLLRYLYFYSFGGDGLLYILTADWIGSRLYVYT